MASRTLNCCFLSLHVLLACVIASSGSQEDDAKNLLKFRDSLSNTTQLNNWNATVPMCKNNTANWNGLICLNNALFGLQLETMGLGGIIDMDTLAALPTLKTISFMNNSFDGPMPSIKNLGALRGFYISGNQFFGEIPDDAFSGMKLLKKVYLANNRFTGKIPKFLFDESGNNLCGKPLSPCASEKHFLPKFAIIVIAAGLAALAVIIIGLMVIHSRGRHQASKYETGPAGKVQKKKGGYQIDNKEVEFSNKMENYKKGEQGKLNFVRKDRQKFELQDLLRASAEVLGSGNFGSSYKANLLNGPALVVKRFRQMSSVGREEFYEHMRRLGRLSHPNLLPLVAFYYKREEKLLITDFAENGSLASHLHGNSSPNQPGLDWPTRLKIIKGVARGLAYLYQEFPSLTLPHGHLKSSNVLLDLTFEPLLSDYALVPVINKDHAHQFMVSYKSPEFTHHDRTNKKTDIWCLGILILELLTGKFPANYLKQGKGGNSDLATWVNSVVREEWTGEVFDKDMKGTKNGEGEMLKLLKIGMYCCEWKVERRWDLREAVDKIEELKERDSDEDLYSSYASEGEMYSSRAMTDDDFSFSVTG
ncbi:hypothetical protein RJ640_012320 [Escallonia rubra]|uniref:non-specific serine/threonine protein kinase n=1 Tax=Escallonia rubra TaxID=112253 RepID=A0AA88UQ78_9ASTE|nr:hypothetical protein RJ640_012320 [Escallonia rubra]